MAKFKNLEAEMVRKGINKDDLVKVLGGSKSSVYRKLTGECRISVDEAQKVNKTLKLNVNIKKSVKRQSNGEIELSTPLPHEPQEGDSFYIYAGCDKTMTMCKNKFKNFANFNGTPFIPKADSSL